MNEKLNKITSFVAEKAKELFGEKLDSVILYGSYARGDYDKESDVDIFITAEIPEDEAMKYTYEMRELIYMFEIENDCLISISITPKSKFIRRHGVLPYYQNIEREGVRIAS